MTGGVGSALEDALVDHEFRAHSSSRGGINTHHAGCMCGAGYDWYDREAQHQQHLDVVTVAWADARVAKALRDAANDPGLRLSGHSGISISRLRARADQIDPPAQTTDADQ